MKRFLIASYLFSMVIMLSEKNSSFNGSISSLEPRSSLILNCIMSSHLETVKCHTRILNTVEKLSSVNVDKRRSGSGKSFSGVKGTLEILLRIVAGKNKTESNVHKFSLACK